MSCRYLIGFRGVNDKIFLAEIAAYQGKYTEAAKIYSECGKGIYHFKIYSLTLHAVDKAIDMFTDLRQWEDAKKFAQAADKLNIMVLFTLQYNTILYVLIWFGRI